MTKKPILLETVATVATAAALLGAGLAQAQSAGSLIVSGGATSIVPQVQSGDLSAPGAAGIRLNIAENSQPSGSLVYMLTNNIAIDFPIAVPYTHRIRGEGAIGGVGVVGTLKSLPITLVAQYRFFDPDSMFRPYIGAGVTYAYTYDTRSTAVLSGITGGTPARPTTLSLSKTAGPDIKLGLAINVLGNWSIDISATKSFLNTTGRLSTGQTIALTLDPLAYSVLIGYRFDL